MTPPYNCITNILANENVDTWLPTGRTVPDMPSYFSNNATYNAKDYGAVGDNSTDDRNTINTLASAVIPSGGELYLPPGQYRIGSNLTIPATVATRFASGAILVPDNGVIVTVLGPLSAGRTRIFDGDGTFEFGTTTQIDWFYPQWWGAIGDGARPSPHDDEPAFTAMMQAMRDGYSVDCGSSFVYLLNNTIRIGYSITLRMTGSVFSINHDGIGIDLSHYVLPIFGYKGNEKANTLDVDLAVVKRNDMHACGSIGIFLRNSFWGKFNIQKSNGFELGMHEHSTPWNSGIGESGGDSYNQFHLYDLQLNRYGLLIDAEDSGYVTENLYLGGEWGGGDDHGHVDSYGIKIAGGPTWNSDNLVFVKPSIEGWNRYGIIMDRAYYNTIIAPRMEMPAAVKRIKFTENSAYNSIQIPVFLLANFNSQVEDLGTFNAIDTTLPQLGRILYSNKVVYRLGAPGSSYELTGHVPALTNFPIIPLGGKGTSINTGHSGTAVCDLRLARYFRFDVTGNITSVTVTNPNVSQPYGDYFFIEFNQDATGKSIGGFSGINPGTFGYPVPRPNGSDLYCIARKASGWVTVGHWADDGKGQITMSTNVSDNDITLAAQTSDPIQRFGTALSINRTATLPGTGLYNGLEYTFFRTGLGAGSLIIQTPAPATLFTIPAYTAATVRIVYDGGTWRVLAYEPVRLNGTGTLVSGTATITANGLNTGDRIFLQRTSLGLAPGILCAQGITAGTGFTVVSTSNTDDGTFDYQIVKP